ncbi:MAG: KAP family NTPase [Paracoccaceae bacterium]|nr:KAP family NTPase [Paracoccaceae bacterium]
MQSEEPLANIWQHDLLNRRRDAEFLQDFIESRIAEQKSVGLSRNYILNLDAEWGTGKTFFLTRLQKHLNNSGRLCVYINAWENDYTEDAFVPIMAEINAAIRPFYTEKTSVQKFWTGVKQNAGRIAIEIGRGASKQALRKAIGEGYEHVSDLIDESESESDFIKGGVAEAGVEGSIGGIEKVMDRYAEALLNDFEAKKNSISSFKYNLAKLIDCILKGKNSLGPIYVLIDELDRCRPDYAISLLERVKHLFSVENIVFVIATDTSQLRHAVSAIYGLNFQGARYLRRFFDRTYKFNKPNTLLFVRKLFHTYQVDVDKVSCPLDDPIEYFSNVMAYCEISMRDIERSFDILRTSITLWKKDVPLDLVYLCPLIILYNSGDEEAFDRIVKLDVDYIKSSIFNNDFSFEMFVEGTDGEHLRSIRNEQLLREIMGRLTKNLIESGDSEYSYAREIFLNEFRVIHDSRLSLMRQRVDSVLLTYPELVRGSARFAEPDE